MYPERLNEIPENKKGFFRIFKFWKSSHPKATSDDSVTPYYSTEEMVKECVWFYLEPCRQILLKEEGHFPGFTIDDFVRNVNLIYIQLKQPHVQQVAVDVRVPNFVCCCSNILFFSRS